MGYNKDMNFDKEFDFYKKIPSVPNKKVDYAWCMVDESAKVFKASITPGESSIIEWDMRGVIYSSTAT